MSKEQKTVERAPIIVVMGHVDHGKSALLDYIRKSNVVDKEAGGITQHISAYEVERKDGEGNSRMITFLDTPGHEAFVKMRARGSKIADIAILVVSAEEGVKTQTLEAYRAIQESALPCIVAINKIDKPGANIEKVKTSLLEHEIYLEGFGGDIPWVPISAKTGEGVNELLDMVLLLSDLRELKGEPHKHAEGVVIEANRDTQKGISATLLIKDGTIKKGQFVRTGSSIAPVRIMEDFTGKDIDEATFSAPVKIVGFDTVPAVGEPFKTYDKKKLAIEDALTHKTGSRINVQQREVAPEEDETAVIPIIVKADVGGSIEAIEHEIEKLKNDQINVKIIETNVGTVSEGDVKLALSSPNSIIVGFNVSVDSAARELAKRNDVTVETFDVIYKLAEWLDSAIKTRAPKQKVEEMIGRAIILKVFSKTKDKQVIGGRVESGTIKEGALVRIIRREHSVGNGTISSLQQQKVRAKEVTEGLEFGAQIDSRIELAPKDTIESFTVVEK